MPLREPGRVTNTGQLLHVVSTRARGMGREELLNTWNRCNRLADQARGHDRHTLQESAGILQAELDVRGIMVD